MAVRIFLGGVACIVAATGLGFYLAHEASVGVDQSLLPFEPIRRHQLAMAGVRIRAGEDRLPTSTSGWGWPSRGGAS